MIRHGDWPIFTGGGLNRRRQLFANTAAHRRPRDDRGMSASRPTGTELLLHRELLLLGQGAD